MELYNQPKNQDFAAIVRGRRLSQSALSQHLARLRRSHLVKTRRESQTIYYSIADPGVTKVIGALYDLYCGPSIGRELERKRK
jgi:DNA-binding transcriptional ArsR family regulator